MPFAGDSPSQSPAVTACPLFVTFGDISPRHGENLSKGEPRGVRSGTKRRKQRHKGRAALSVTCGDSSPKGRAKKGVRGGAKREAKKRAADVMA